MGRKKKILKNEESTERMSFSRNWPMEKTEKIDKIKNIKKPLEESLIVIPTPQPIEPPGITINEYLTDYSQNRRIDNVFTKWFRDKDSSNPRKPVSEWDEQINSFLNEVV
jgi:hypothetical protein